MENSLIADEQLNQLIQDLEVEVKMPKIGTEGIFFKKSILFLNSSVISEDDLGDHGFEYMIRL